MVPDAEMLISISEIFDTPVNTLLGENIIESKEDDLKVILKKLEVINQQLYHKQELKKKRIIYLLIGFCISIIIVFVFLLFSNSPYLNWNYDNPEDAILKVAYHSFEWLFIRIAPMLLTISILGIVLVKNNKI